MENITEEERQSPVPHGVYFLPEAVEKKSDFAWDPGQAFL